MPSNNTYHLTWVSLTLDMGSLFTTAPAKRSHYFLPQNRGISSQPRSCTVAATTLVNVRSMNQGKLEVVKQEVIRVNIDILGISELR